MDNKYGMLTIIKKVDAPEHLKDKSSTYYLCKCDCGKEKIIRRTSIMSGVTTSCGCHRKKLQSKRAKEKCTHNHSELIGTRFYTIWSGMKQRCSNPNVDSYSNYGEKGIKVCDKWMKFDGFVNDMYDSYIEFEEKHGEGTASIDRIDFNGNYELDNCRWETIVNQNRNKSTNINIELDGVKYNTLSELAEEYNVDYQLVAQRYRNGKRGEELIVAKKKTHNGTKHKSIAVEVNGVSYESFTALQKDYPYISVVAISKRYKKGLRGAELVARPKSASKST